MLRHPIRLGLVAFAVATIAAVVVLPSAGAIRSGTEVSASASADAPAAASARFEPVLPKAVAALQAREQAIKDQQLQDLANSIQLQEYADAVNAAQAQADAASAAQAQAEARRTAAASASAAAPAAADGSVWDRLAACETGGRWATNSVPGYSGGLGFANSSWASFGGTAYAPQAWQASREAQIAVAERILASQGWRAWPACSAKLGLR